MKHVIYSISFILIFSACDPDYTGKDILKISSETLKSNSFYEYGFERRIKYFNASDTTHIKEDFQVYKQPEDSILGFYVISGSSKTGQKVYDGKRVLFVSHASKVIREGNLVDMGQGNIKNNFNWVPAFIYSENPFKTELEQAEIINLTDTIINAKSLWKVHMNMPTNTDITHYEKYVYIDKENFLPVKIIVYAKFQDIQDEFAEWSFNFKDYGHKKMTAFIDDSFESYTQMAYKQSQTRINQLDNDIGMIPFIGTDLNNKIQSINAQSSDNKLILLDFWYLGCTPCLKAMPFLETLHQKYKSNGLEVLGINGHDNVHDDEIVRQIRAFKDKNKTTYKFLFVDKSVTKDYQVAVYPTVYLIKEGKIVYSDYGYSEAKKKRLDSIINVIMK